MDRRKSWRERKSKSSQKTNTNTNTITKQYLTSGFGVGCEPVNMLLLAMFR